jgi:predicted Zn-dependent protease
MDRSRPEEAIESLRVMGSYELSIEAKLEPIYLRGQAYLMLGDGNAATIEFTKIMMHPGLVMQNPISALAHLGLARAYAMQSESAKAKTAYKDFLTLWKDADPDIPFLKQAKAEYAKLQ